MSYYKRKNHIGSVTSYATPGRPFATSSIAVAASGSVMLVELGGVSRRVTIKNTTPTASAPAPMRVGFSESGTLGLEDANYFVLQNMEEFSGEWRVIELYLSSDGGTAPTASVIAEMTTISDPTPLSGNWSGSYGVG